MKKARNFILIMMILTMLFTCMYPITMSFAEDEESTDSYTEDEEPVVDNSDTQPITSTTKGNGSIGDLAAYWKFDGDFKDSSPNKNDGIKIGNISFVDGVLGKAAKFDGKSYVEVKDSDSLNLTNGFTFSLWVYKDEMRKKELMDGGVPYLLKNSEPDEFIPYSFWEWHTMTPGVYFGDQFSVNSDKQVDLQKWTLVTATYDGKTVKIYNNKDLVKSTLCSEGIAHSSQPLYIGFGNFMTVDNFFKGIMDDVRIYNRALSYNEVENLYNASSTSSGKDLVNKPNALVALYKFENNGKDSTIFKNDGTVINARGGIKYVDGINGKAAKFNGASYFEIKDSDSLDLDRGFTFGVWIYKEKSSTNQPVFAKYGESHDKAAASYKLIDWNENSGQRLSIFDFTDESNAKEFETDDINGNSDGRWFYYTATYDGQNVKKYINGVLIGTEPFDGDISNSTGPLWIGATTDSVFFKGIMDELRIYNYALKPTEVKNLYNMRDGIEALVSKKSVSAVTLKAKQTLQLETNLVTYTYKQTDNLKQNPAGKDLASKTGITNNAIYKSGNSKIISISKSGSITALSKGKTTLTITYGRFTKSITVTVN